MFERILGGQIPMRPTDAIKHDFIGGGRILSEIDICAAIAARSVVPSMDIALVTRAMEKVEFNRPVRVGDVLCSHGKVRRIGRTSVTVDIEVSAQRRKEIIPVTTATAIFVGIGHDGIATPVDGSPRSSLIKPAAAAEAQPQPMPQTGASGRTIALRKAMFPDELNGMGHIFGGRLLTYLEWAGSYVAELTCTNSAAEACVVRLMDKIEFRQAVEVNDILTCYGRSTRVGTTSIAVHVEVEVERKGVIIPVTNADLVFVAVDRFGRKVSALA